MVMHSDEIQIYLPHRYPFLLVDRVLALSPGEIIEGYKNVSHNEPFFSGHFPFHPVMPGVLILEAMAQISGILGYVTFNDKPSEQSIYYFAGADKVKFKRAVFPGDQLVLKSNFLVKKRSIWKFACEAIVDDGLTCKADITCVRKELKK